MTRQDTGKLGEILALDYLKKHGYKILETNYRCQFGEIDIVARQKKSLVFVEVRSKSNLEFGTPAESVTTGKQRRIRASAFHYLQEHKVLPETWRIDFVSVELDEKGKAKIEIIENAVDDV